MAFSGYLIKLGGSNGTNLPMKYIKSEGYSITPNQRMETSATRSVTGVLHRSTVQHTASKIEIKTPPITNKDLNAMLTLIKAAWTSTIERKLTLYYYDVETDAYKTGDFYMPDIQYEINRIDLTNNMIHYNEVRIAFIEY